MTVAGPDAAATPLDDALALLRAAAEPMCGTETVQLADAGGRFLAEPLLAPRDVPGFDNAAVDGWAFAWTPQIGRSGADLAIASGRSAAGHPYPAPLPSGSAVRILTGAMVPAGADTIAADERCEVADGTVRVPPGFVTGANRRLAGEDLAAGTTVIPADARLEAGRLGLAALCGVATLPVRRKLRVALLSTGDELLEPGAAPRAGAVFDANRPMLRQLLSALPVDLTDLGILRDDAAAMCAALRDASESHDVVVTTGGASGGDEDHVAAAIAVLGRIVIRRVAMKPGRPTVLGRIGGTWTIGLSGNPAAAFVGYALLARPLLVRLAGGTWTERSGLLVEAGFDLDKPLGRSELVRVTLDRSGKVPRASRVERQGSGMLRGLAEADGLVELGPDLARIRQGERVTFHDLMELIA